MYIFSSEEVASSREELLKLKSWAYLGRPQSQKVTFGNSC